MKPDIRIGCSGYYYSYWKERFYPKGLQPKAWLSYYSSVFNTVELNGTFYRIPKATDLQRYAAVTDDSFRFSVKVNRAITHTRKLADCKELIRDFSDLVRSTIGHKLSHFLYQLPPSFQYSEENLERVLETIPHASENVVEFRHASWWNPQTEAALRSAKLTFCNVDFPGLETPFIHTSPLFYFRLHGNPILFKSAYSEETLRAFAAQFPANAEAWNIYFNNTYYEAGYTNARQLISLLAESNAKIMEL